MSEPNKDNAKRAQDLISRTLTQQVRATQRYYDLLARFGRGEISAQALTEETLRFASKESGQYASDLAELSLRFYSDLLAMNQAYGERYLRALQGERAAGQEAAVAGTATPRRVGIALRAPLGQEAVGAFVLENKRGGNAQIVFEVTDFFGPPDTEPFRPGLILQPDRFVLEPGQEQAVTMRLPLRNDVFAAGEHYSASVIVHGYENLVLDVSLDVDEPV